MISRIIDRGLSYLQKPKAEADDTIGGLDNFAIMRKPNSIIVLLYNYKCRILSEVYEVSHAMTRFSVNNFAISAKTFLHLWLIKEQSLSKVFSQTVKSNILLSQNGGNAIFR